MKTSRGFNAVHAGTQPEVIGVAADDLGIELGFKCFYFFNYTATTEIYTLSLHDALPIYLREELTLAQPFFCSPTFDLPLQRPQLPRCEPPRVSFHQILEQRLRLQPD